LRVLVISAIVPFQNGDEHDIAQRLRLALIQEGNESDLACLPFDGYHRDLPGQMLSFRLLDLSQWADVVITIGAPGWAVSHPNKRVWFFSYHQPLYELWNTRFGVLDMPHNRILRQEIIEADRVCLREATRVLAASSTAIRSLNEYCGIDAALLRPPPPDIADSGQTERKKSIVCLGAFSDVARHELLITALKYTRSDVQLIIASESTSPSYKRYLEESICVAGVSDRVVVLDNLNDFNSCLMLLREARACVNVSYAASWCGLSLLYAYQLGLPVITCSDSHGVAEIVKACNQELVVPPEAEQLARVFDEVCSDWGLATKLGKAVRSESARLFPSWNDALEGLLR
jgi:glycosyltransferase involved in cell wall biosynthesis